MANVDTLKVKVQNAQEKVEKVKKTIARHEAQLEKKRNALIKKGYDISDIEALRDKLRGTDESWEVYDVQRKEDDIINANKKLIEAQKILSNWEEKLSLETEKERFLNNEAPQVIIDFLNQWKELAFEWHVKRYDAFLEFSEKLNKEVEEAKVELGVQAGRAPSRDQNKQLKEMHLDYATVQQRKASFAGAVVLKMKTYYSEEERLAYLEKVLEQERKSKMLDLINRINSIVGAITDASGLRISNQGNLNGIITGEKGKAKVETIGAGGWNIQCFHYRTLVHEVK